MIKPIDKLYFIVLKMSQKHFDVLASLNYSKSISPSSGFENDPWYIDTISCPMGTKFTNFKDNSIPVTITDIRGQENLATLDTTGFQTFLSSSSVPTSVLLSGNDDFIKKTYFPEVEAILKAITNADHVIFFDLTIRKSEDNSMESPQLREPVLRVHVDQTPKAAHHRISLHVPKELRNFQRFQIINLWRPIANPVYDYPLAMLDFRSVDLNNDLVPTLLRYPDWLKDKETYAVKYNPNHKWYYWSHMEPTEVLLIKCYDSASRKLAQAKHNSLLPNQQSPFQADIAGLSPHSAFFNEKDAMIGVPRQSIEVRAIVLHM